MEDKKRNQVLSVLFLGVLMGALDIAIVGPAMPAIRTSFGISERAGSWIFGIYVLFNLIGTPLMAKLSDVFGRRVVYLADISLFALGSLITALSVAPNFWLLLVGRGIQGFGAGGIFPVASAVIGDTFPAEKRGGALGLIGAVFGIAFLIGPLLGSAVLKLAGWNWLFLINLPIAAVIMGMAFRLLPDSHPAKSSSFDWGGMFTLAVLLAALAYGINQIDQANLSASIGVALPFLLVAVVLLVVLVLVERKTNNPILPPRLFNRRQLTLAYLLSAGAGIGEVSMVFIPEMVRKSLNIGDNATAGLMMMPVILAMAVGSPVAGRMLDKFGSRKVILFGSSIMTAGMLLMSLFTTNLVMFIVSSLLIGLGLSALLGAPIRYIMLNEACLEERSIAQGTVALFTSTGQLLSGALVGAVAASSSYANAFFMIAIIGLLLVFTSLFLKNRVEERLVDGVAGIQEAGVR
jgi:EmrB/QacA subfamily drug resistance transporter